MSTVSALLYTKVEPSAYKSFARGKVRDIYYLGNGLVIIITTDRISAFDINMATGIPGKGRCLNKMSAFWFRRCLAARPNHLLSTSLRDMPEAFRQPEFDGRIMLCKEAKVIPIECVVRKYITGSLWKEYSSLAQNSYGIVLPPGLRESEELPEPIFTPTTKEPTGHDKPMTLEVFYQTLQAMFGSDTIAAKMISRSLDLFLSAYEFAMSRGIIIADTKFEWGICNGELILVDEVLTPDSSRFWSADDYQPGRPQASFDKQFLRDYLESLKEQSLWDGKEPVTLPEEIVRGTADRYQEAKERIIDA